MQCAATEGQWFTAEAVADVLQLEKAELKTFLNVLLQPYVDEDKPEQEMPGIVTQGDAIQIDPQRPDSIVVEYKFTRPYLYYAWRKHPPLKEKQKVWKTSLAQALIRLYQPYETMILEKLYLLAPHLAEPYRQRQQQQVYLQQLRHQTASLLDTKKENHYATYRLFAFGTNLLGLLTSNASYAEEGIRLAQAMYERALFWQDAMVEAEIARYWGWHLHNTGQYIKALPLYKRAVHLCETENLDQLLYAASLNNLGTLLQAIGKYEEARPFYERALAIREEQLGSQHPDTARSIWRLGVLAEEDGDLTKARNLYQQALTIYESALGANHPSTKNIRHYYNRVA